MTPAGVIDHNPVIAGVAFPQCCSLLLSLFRIQIYIIGEKQAVFYLKKSSLGGGSCITHKI